MDTKITVERIKAYIKDNDETLESFARKMGVSLNTVWKWTSGTNQPSPLAQEKLHALMGDK